jgi:hypothetical protein
MTEQNEPSTPPSSHRAPDEKVCDCEGPQKIGPGYHAPYCSAHPWCPNCGGKDGEHKPGCVDGCEIL